MAAAIDFQPRDKDDARILIGTLPASDGGMRLGTGREHQQAGEGSESQELAHVGGFSHSESKFPPRIFPKR